MNCSRPGGPRGLTSHHSVAVGMQDHGATTHANWADVHAQAVELWLVIAVGQLVGGAVSDQATPIMGLLADRRRADRFLG